MVPVTTTAANKVQEKAKTSVKKGKKQSTATKNGKNLLTIYFCFQNSLNQLIFSKFSVKAVYKQKYMIVLIGVADISNRKY